MPFLIQDLPACTSCTAAEKVLPGSQQQPHGERRRGGQQGAAVRRRADPDGGAGGRRQGGAGERHGGVGAHGAEDDAALAGLRAGRAGEAQVHARRRVQGGHEPKQAEQANLAPEGLPLLLSYVPLPHRRRSATFLLLLIFNLRTSSARHRKLYVLWHIFPRHRSPWPPISPSPNCTVMEYFIISFSNSLFSLLFCVLISYSFCGSSYYTTYYMTIYGMGDGMAVNEARVAFHPSQFHSKFPMNRQGVKIQSSMHHKNMFMTSRFIV